uniref:Mitochondrial MinE n=1 Tax=Stygiella incarcerata TaxID=1712417 RepID=A0A0E3SU93_9EUKA|nr:mitochondrial MinE [Stygiella incarcerata]
MGFLSKLFGGGKSTAVAESVVKSASVAKDRLHIILASQRALHRLEHLNVADLQSEIMNTIQKYVTVDAEKATLSIRREGVLDVFELQVPLS